MKMSGQLGDLTFQMRQGLLQLLPVSRVARHLKIVKNAGARKHKAVAFSFLLELFRCSVVIVYRGHLSRKGRIDLGLDRLTFPAASHTHSLGR